MLGKCRVCGKETGMKTKLCQKHNNNIVTLNRFNAKTDEDKDVIIGNLDPSLLQSGTPEAVYEASRRVIEKGKSLSAGFIFSTGCDLPPRSNIENVMAMTEAVNDFGWH